jgi:hypothetical protein
MNSIALLIVLLQLLGGQTAISPLDRLRAKTAVDPVTKLTPVQIAGQYKNPSNELIKLIGPPLGGNNLYIFPDNTYVYCEWDDIMANTVYDKGTWSFSAGVLQLKSGPEITWDTRLERGFLAVRRRSHDKEILLVGLERDLPYFEEQAGHDPESMLLIVARVRDKTISQAAAAGLRSRLIREAWRPDFFREH